MLFEEIDNIFDKDGGRLLPLHVITLNMSELKEMGKCNGDRRLAWVPTASAHAT